MIPDDIDYGDGYCKATEPGPGVQWKTADGGWNTERWWTKNDAPLEPEIKYRRPMTQAEKPKADELVDMVVDGYGMDGMPASIKIDEAEMRRIIDMVREHDAKDTAKVILDLCQALERHMDRRSFHAKNSDDAAWEAGCHWLGTNAAKTTGGANV